MADPANPAGASAVKRKHLRGRLLALTLGLTVGLVVAFAVAEVYLRTSGSHRLGGVALYHGLWENDGQGGIRPVPGFVKTNKVAGRSFTYRLNSLGMRGPEIGVKRAGEVRVLFLGDSMVFGHGVDIGETFPVLLESKLAAAIGRPVTVGNGGLPMNGEVDQVRDLRRLAGPFAPDVVLSCIYLGNDFVDNYYGPKEVAAGFVVNTHMARFYKSSPRARAMFHSRVIFEIELWLTDRFPSLAIPRYKLDPTPEEARRFEDLPTCSWEEGLFMDAKELTPGIVRPLDKMETALAELQQIAGPVPLLAVIVPTHNRILPGEYRKALAANNLDTGAYELGIAQSRVKERCQRLGIPAIDLTTALRVAQVDGGAPDSTVLPGDFHFSPAGNAVVAATLLPWLEAELRLRGVLK